ncbi:MAG TPA: hypothetical protein VGG85_15005 [Terracidiphilus sp.]|jgi:hypothetical protein
MGPVTTPAPVKTTSLLPAILVGGGVAGTFDLISAFATFGFNMPRGIAAGLIGRQAVQSGGAAFTWTLGVFLHYFIAFSAAAVYCFASRKLPFLKENFVVCGLFYGMGFYLVMNLIVLPLCALHLAGPYQLRGLLIGLLFHMFLIALPISLSLRMLSGDKGTLYDPANLPLQP